VVLVDVQMLLAGGEGMYNGARELLELLLDYLQPGVPPMLGWARKALQFELLPDHRYGHTLRRVAFVATKADLVGEDSRSNLDALLREMVSPLIRKHRVNRRLDVDYFWCAAVKSTKAAPDGRLQAYRPGETDAPVSFDPVPVPDHWPLTWQPGEYECIRVAPWMPPRRDTAPEHIGLDEVMRFALGWKR
jgi:predicted YcjX-like family ATPase